MCTSLPPFVHRSDRGDCPPHNLFVDSGQAACAHDPPSVQEASGDALTRDPSHADCRVAMAEPSVGEEWIAREPSKDGFGSRNRADGDGECEALQSNGGCEQIQDQTPRSISHQSLLSSRRTSAWAWPRSFDADERQPGRDGRRSACTPLFSPERSCECHALPDSLSENERDHDGRKLQCDVWVQRISAKGKFYPLPFLLVLKPSYTEVFSLPCREMKKRLRAEIYESFINMGQAAMLVQPAQQYLEVRQRLSNTMLCGAHARTVELELPPRQEKKRRTPRGMAREVFEIEEILAEEPPTRTHWRRYLVRWAGYRPEWEVWRLEGRGAPGDPIETWEPLAMVRHTEALERWILSKQMV